MKVIKQSVLHIASTTRALQLIESAGRTCYKSEDKINNESAENFVKMIIKRGHESVLEHASASFRIVTDRGISHEIVRHRLASYSQESTRYVKYGDLEVIIPSSLVDNTWSSHFGTCWPVYLSKDRVYGSLTVAQRNWVMACLKAESCYRGMIDAGEKPQIARSVLPTCLKTELVMTANFREWRHFILMRASVAAHPQVNEIAKMIYGWFADHYAAVVDDLRVVQIPHKVF